MSQTSTYTVTGMTSDHCVASVREEVGEVPGVTDVDVDLASGRVDVTAASTVDDDAGPGRGGGGRLPAGGIGEHVVSTASPARTARPGGLSEAAQEGHAG